LGGGVLVGITLELLDCWIYFEARTNNISEGTVTTADATGTSLIDSAATFQTDGVTVGDTVINQTDKSLATVTKIVSQNELTTEPLNDGAEDDYDMGDAYRVYHVEQCNISGGNVVAFDSVGDPMTPIMPSAFTQPIKTSSSSATLQELLDIQQSSFNGAVWIDAVNGTVGTAYPIGTTRPNPSGGSYACKYLSDARAIAISRGLCCLSVIGNYTFEATDNIDGFRIVGQSPNLSTITVTSGCSTVGTEFETCILIGTLSGSTFLHMLSLGNLSGFVGTANQCVLGGNISLAGTSSDDVNFLFCSSGVPGSGTPEIDMNGDGPGVGFRGYQGGALAKNKTGASSVSMDFVSGQFKLADTVTGGAIVARGTGKLIEASTGDSIPTGTWNGVTITNETTNPTYVAQHVWDLIPITPLANSMGDFIIKLWDEAGGKRKLDATTNQEIFYKEDNVTEVMRFNLFDRNGNPTVEDVYERVRV
jgi:hypothetical protein